MEHVIQPTVLQNTRKENRCDYQLHIPRNLIYFRGHFDELAILPGVAQLKWVIDFAKQDMQQSSSTSINRLKFMRPILPDQCVSLSIECTATGNIDFRYYDEKSVYSQGQICYE